MKKQFNKLSPAEAERLFILLEELGEAQQAIGKILRHGYLTGYPKDGPNNKAILELELGDVLLAIDMLAENHDIDYTELECRKAIKAEKIKMYLHHQ